LARVTAAQLAKTQKKISISEFFERNKHILGFDSKTRALLTAVKEGVDNSLDACEEAGILPEIEVKIEDTGAPDEFAVTIGDNGPGIIRNQISNVFGRLLYGSRFHVIRQSRGQQGIGVSAVVMYGQLTTGKAVVIRSKTGEEEPSYRVKLILNTKKNLPEVISRKVILMERPHGTSFTVYLKGRYVRNRKQSIYEYIHSTAIVNPHARFTLTEPDGTVNLFERATDKMPKATVEIKPHPKGLEIGTLLKIAKDSKAYKLTSFFVKEFSRVSYSTARKICAKAEVPETTKPSKLKLEDANRLLAAIETINIMSPPTDCLSPIGEILMKKGLKKEIDAKFIITVTRDPSVFQGTPFQVEAGLVYGGDLPKDKSIVILRFANRVPLLYQQGGCVITKGLEEMDWRQYHLEQRGGRGIPVGPVMVIIHIASTNIPFTSESKEAIANLDVIKTEVQLAVRECARRMRTHIKRRKKLKKMVEKYSIIQKLLPEIARKSSEIVGLPLPDIAKVITNIMNVVVVEDRIVYEKREGPDFINTPGNVQSRLLQFDEEHTPPDRDGSDGREKRTKWTTKSYITVTNYTPKKKSITMYVKIPQCLVTNIIPKPRSQGERVIIWDLKNIGPTASELLCFEIMDLDKGDYDKNEVFFSGTTGEVIGAEKMHF
jgi:DNA topoisomerase-6 subunit B